MGGRHWNTTQTNVSSCLPEQHQLLFVRVNEISQVLILRFHKQVESHIHTSLLCHTLVLVFISHNRILFDQDSVRNATVCKWSLGIPLLEFSVGRNQSLRTSGLTGG